MVRATLLLILFCGIDAAIVGLSAAGLSLLALSYGVPALAVILTAPFVLAAMAWISWELSSPLWTAFIGSDECEADRLENTAARAHGVIDARVLCAEAEDHLPS